MKVVINEIINQLYEAVKKCNNQCDIQPLMERIGRLKISHSENLIIEALGWIAFTLYMRLTSCEEIRNELEKELKNIKKEV